MQIVPSTPSLRVLLLLSERLSDRPGWIPVAVLDDHVSGEISDPVVDGAISELIEIGYLLPAAFGEVVYVTGSAATLSRAARALLRSGVPLAELTWERIASHLYP